MRYAVRLLPLAALAVVAACAAPPPPTAQSAASSDTPSASVAMPALPRPPAIVPVRVWTKPGTGMTDDDVMEGCRYWTPAGVRCERASSEAAANIHVKASARACPTEAALNAEARRKGEAGIERFLPQKPGCPDSSADPDVNSVPQVFALTTGTDVTMYVRCLADDVTHQVNHARLRMVIAHEIGHALGLNHVPVECGDRCIEYKTRPDGRHVCGLSVMGFADQWPTSFSEADQMAFDVRDRSKIPSLPPSEVP